MFTVQEVLPALQRVLGTCDSADILERVNSAIEILSAESDWDPTVGYVDITVDTERSLTLPRGIEGILAINLGGKPTMGHDKWFQYHLNGPGNDCYHRDDSWVDNGPVVTISDPTEVFKLVAFLDSADDNNIALRVFGYDENDRWIVSTEGGSTVDGFLVPTIYGTAVVNPDVARVKKITRITKPITKGFVRLQTEVGELIGIYEPTETEPQYRRITVGRECTWARVQYKKRIFKLTSYADLIPLHSPYAVVLMVKALKKFDEDRLDEGEAYQLKAVQLLKKKQLSVSPPSGPSIQIADRNLICSKRDRMDF